MYIISESTGLTTIPKKMRHGKNGNLRFEACLQTCDDFNRNKRRYGRDLLEGGLRKVSMRIREGSFIGELDHPIDSNPVRQTTTLYKAASHRILDWGWEGNKLIGVMETLRTPNGTILKHLAEDGVPVGFSFRGMGDLREVRESGQVGYEVLGPLHVVTWDSVSYPSHAAATLTKITESVVQEIKNYAGAGCSSPVLNEAFAFMHDSKGINECNGLICTSEGICYIPNDFDKLVDQRVIMLKDKFQL